MLILQASISLPIISRPAPFKGSAYRSNVGGRLLFGTKTNRGVTVSDSYEEQSSSIEVPKRRKIIEHVCLLKSKKDLSNEEEKDMLDYLYTTQYQMRHGRHIIRSATVSTR